MHHNVSSASAAVRIPVAEPLERRLFLAAAPAPITDFSPPDPGTGAAAIAIGGGVSFYAHNDGVHGYELWRADPATPHGRILKDINPSAYDVDGRTASSHPTSFFSLGNLVLFIADDGVSGRELWRTDGTAGGTYRLAETRAGYDGIASGTLKHASFAGGAIVLAGGHLLFTAGTASTSRSLGTVADEALFTADGSLYWLDGARRHVFSFDGISVRATFTLSGMQTVSEQALSLDDRGRLVFNWTTNGWPAARSESHVIVDGAGGLALTTIAHPAVNRIDPIGQRLGTYSGLAFYRIPGRGMFATDGTSAGLRLLLPETAGTAGPIVALGRRAYFIVERPIDRRRELWSTDGTAEGTAILTAIDVENVSGLDAGSAPPLAFNNRLVFVARANQRWELRSVDPDTFAHGFDLLAITPTATPEMLVSNGLLFIVAYDAPSRVAAYYRSDGTNAGTTLVYRRAVADGAAPSIAANVLGEKVVVVPSAEHVDDVLDESLVFTLPGPSTTTHRFVQSFRVGQRLILRYDELAANGQHTFELWRTDGTASGTAKILDLPAQRFNDFAVFGDLLLFSADGIEGNELYRSDGTRNGTYQLRDIHALGDSNATLLAGTTAFQFFLADDGINGPSLWRTDGTVAGTILLKGFGGRLGAIQSATTIADVCYFLADDGIHGMQLWRSDGTKGGTHYVPAGTVTGSHTSDVPQLAGDGVIVAPAFAPSHGAELFVLSNAAPTNKPIAAPYISGGTLRIFGTSASDVIRVARRGGAEDVLDVLVNDDAYAFRFADVSVIRIHALEGNDVVEAITPIPTAVQGGAGNDTIKTGDGRDTLYGGDGDDALYGGANTDWLFGDAGNDRLNGGGGRDILWGGPGKDTFVSSLLFERRDWTADDDLLR